MSDEAVKMLSIAAIIVGGTMVPAISIGFLAAHAMEAMGRNPAAISKIQTSMILVSAFIEAIAIYALVVALIVKFV